MKAMTDMQEVVDIFDTPIDILDPVKPECLVISEGHIVFKNVSFQYKDGVTVLKDFNLDIAPGERVGLVGHSGAGKSTITKLLLRFSDVKMGEIIIDGQNIKNITQNDLRSVISYVPQEPILFHRTIGENITYSKPGATQEEIIKVAKKAFAHDFIMKLPRGYDTLVGERGIKLSGGERQRIAIARAMLKNSPILVLDEATSSLDSTSEGYIQSGFEELMKGKTTIVVAHRLSTISKMDRIVVLEDGDIAEMGTHKELIKHNGAYASFWNHQTGGFLEPSKDDSLIEEVEVE
jgi:ATP-binding cassette subfamily B protein